MAQAYASTAKRQVLRYLIVIWRLFFNQRVPLLFVCNFWQGMFPSLQFLSANYYE